MKKFKNLKKVTSQKVGFFNFVTLVFLRNLNEKMQKMQKSDKTEPKIQKSNFEKKYIIENIP